jgi:hypothetical protein
MMRKVIHTVLDITYEGLVIERETYNLVDKWMETFTVKGGGDIMTFSNYYNGKGVQYRVNSFLDERLVHILTFTTTLFGPTFLIGAVEELWRLLRCK